MSFDLQGHRGAAGLAPENSLAAFGIALEIGVSTLELDVGVTRDGAVVVDHERRAPDGTPWLELNAAAVDVPTLDDVLALAAERGADGVRFAVEAKLDPTAPDETLPPRPFAERVLACVARHRTTDRVLLQSFDWRVLVEARALEPALALAALADVDTVFPGSPWTAGLAVTTEDPFAGELAALAATLGAAAVAPQHELVGDALVDGAHRLGLRVHTWTVNDPAELAGLLDRGVDGVATDYPDRAREVLAARGLPLPPRYPPRR